MGFESRAYDDGTGAPVVVLVVTGTHDVGRLVALLNGGPLLVEQMLAGDRIKRQVRRRAGGRAALELLRAHGGPDLRLDGPETLWWVPDDHPYNHPELHTTKTDAQRGAINRYRGDNPDRANAVFTWEPENPGMPDGVEEELVADGRATGLIVVPVAVREPKLTPARKPAAAAAEPQSAGI